MFKNIKIGKKIELGFGLVLILVITVILIVDLSKMRSLSKKAQLGQLEQMYAALQQSIDKESYLAEALAQQIASLDDVSAKFAARDREALATMMLPAFKILKQRYGVKQFQFHTPDGHSFLRVHKPEKFGDDLSSFRKTVVQANTAKSAVRGLEKGVAGIGIRGVVPVSYQGKHQGSVEFGLSLGNEFLKRFKKEFSADAVMYVKDGASFKSVASTLDSTSDLDNTLLQNVFNGQSEKHESYLGDIPVAIYTDSVKDFSGNTIAILQLTMDRSSFVDAQTNARNVTVIIGVVAIGFGLLVAWLIGRGISGRINKTVLALNNIAEGDGDLTQRLDEDSKDELGDLSRSFNKFVTRVHETVKQVSSSTGQLGAAAEEMSAITNNSNSSIQRQRAETEQVATAMNEMTSTVQEVSRHASEAAKSAHNADSETRKGHEIAQSTVNAINSLASEIDHASDVIKRLEEDSQNIGTVLDVIRGIAEQTNLLALNAAIEAARAGEQGRGFAVVADEVRTLASRTQKSTEEINDMIGRLQADAHDAVKAIDDSKKQADVGVNSAKTADASLDTIMTSITNINDMNMQIASAADEQSSVAEEINKNIISINDESEKSADAASQTSAASQEMAILATDLQQLVSRFKI